MHASMHARTNPSLLAYVQSYVVICIYTRTYMYTHTCVMQYSCVYKLLYTFLYMYMYMYMFMYMYIYHIVMYSIADTHSQIACPVVYVNRCLILNSCFATAL